jgi:hypothetical protein
MLEIVPNPLIIVNIPPMQALGHPKQPVDRRLIAALTERGLPISINIIVHPMNSSTKIWYPIFQKNHPLTLVKVV